MFNRSFWIRVLIAVVIAVIALSAIPAIFTLIGVPVSSALITVIRAVVAICALVYIFRGVKQG